MGGANSTEAKPEGDQKRRLLKSKAARPSALLICGPSGVGKGTLINKLMDNSDLFGFSCSHTTRSPRPGETVSHLGTKALCRDLLHLRGTGV